MSFDQNQLQNSRDQDLLFLTNEELRQQVELLFFAYKNFTSDPDRILEKYGLGRAHHRALHFINREPGLTVSTLLSILSITKQSLNRVLRTLIELGYVEIKPGTDDRRTRHLSLTEKGQDFERELSVAQLQRMRAVFAEVGPESVRGFRNVLNGLIDEHARKQINRINKRAR